jgi:DNA-binding GntR family transcriptional regulator
VYESLHVGHSTAVDRVTDELRRALFAGELEPDEPLRELALAHALDVGRSTIREALGLLVAEGLAVRIPNKGVAVAMLSAADVSDVCRSRAVLEIAGLRAWPTASQQARESVREAVADYALAADSGAMTADLAEAHLAFHRSLVGLTDSPRLVAFAETVIAEIRLALARVDRVRRNAREQAASHRALLTLLERGAIEEAVHDLEHHLGHGETSMLEALGHRRATHDSAPGTIDP